VKIRLIKTTVIFIILKFITITEIIAKNDTEEITKLTLMILEIKDVFFDRKGKL